MSRQGWLRALAVAVAITVCAVSGGVALTRSTPTSAKGQVGTVIGTPGPSASPTTTPSASASIPEPFRNPLPGMPPILDNNVYAAATAGHLSPAVAADPARVYVPDSAPGGTTVTVIDQHTFKVIRTLQVGHLSQHVVPSYDMRRLYTNSSVSNQFVVLNPRTSREELPRIEVPRPYNLYFTPDGKQAVVMVEQYNEIRFADPHTFRKRKSITVPGCLGPNHADFAANGRYMVITCEFSGALVKIETLSHKVLGILKFHSTAMPGMSAMPSMPQDVRISPDGRTFYVADMGANVVRRIDAATFKQIGVIHTPANPHGLYPSRDAKSLYISDRGAGQISVMSFATNKIVDTWTIPGGGSPDMGGVSADGRVLWLSGRYNSEVYAINTRTGRLLARIKVPGSPHGLAVWPQPGRYSLGHTGIMR